MTLRSKPSLDDYRLPITPDGAVEFAPDPATGEEQVDFRKSSLDRMARDAIELAEPSHTADPERVDTRRMEFGGTVIEAAATPTPEQKVDPIDLTRPETILAHGQWIVRGFRQVELDNAERGDNKKAA